MPMPARPTRFPETASVYAVKIGANTCVIITMYLDSIVPLHPYGLRRGGRDSRPVGGVIREEAVVSGIL